MNSQLTLILGGARSGKSHHAEQLAVGYGPDVLYVATAQAGDAEMAERIENHRRARPAAWRTLEAPIGVGAALRRLDDRPDVILLDCLTLLATNIVLALEGRSQADIEAAVLAEVDAIVFAQRKLDVPLLVVSNEVGLGLVPPYPVSRVFRDALGRANQRLAAAADRVLLMVAGLPLVVKDVTRRRDEL